jgi:hypothetical protein
MAARPFSIPASWLLGVALAATGCFGEARLGNPDKGRLPDGRSTDSFDIQCVNVPAGRAASRRLTRTEYANSVRDLLFLDASVDPAKDLPPEQYGLDSFTNEASLLRMPPEKAQAYMSAAVTSAAAAFGTPRSKWQSCDLATGGDACARQTLTGLASRAYRHPATAEEVDALMAVYNAGKTGGDSADISLQRAVQAVLVSSRFLYLTFGEGTLLGNHSLTGYELASRLSYLLWQSLPDATLLAAAASGELTSAAGMRPQIERMLNDSRSALTKGFATEWLSLQEVAGSNVDDTLFPGFTADVRRDLVLETQRFVDHVVQQRRPLKELFNADYTFMNARVATHYARIGISGETFQKVPTNAPRLGVLAHASILNVSAGSPIRTSPTIRGHWLLEKMLCKAPPPPPAGIPPLGSTPGTSEGTIKERMEAHRTQESCSGCHALMDPLGMGLENFDVIGKWRESYPDGSTVDATGQFPDGTPVQNASDVLSYIANSADTQTCVTKKVMAYALSRHVGTDDECTAAAIAKVASEPGASLVEVILGVVLTRQFQQNELEEAP